MPERFHPMTARVFDRELLWRRRQRCAGAPDVAAFLLERSADDIAERLDAVRRRFPACLCLGAYHGVLARRLAGLGGIERIVSLERSPDLARLCPSPVVVADEELLPFAEASFDLVVSALALQHVNDLPGALIQIARVLRPDGLLLASLLGPGSLVELRQSMLAAEAEADQGASPRVAPFVDVRDLGSLAQRAGLALPVVDSDTVRVTYPTALHLMRDLKAMGASNALADRRRVPIRRGTLMRAAEIYAEQFAAPGGKVTATFEIVTLTAWTPHPDQPKALRPGSATHRLADVLAPTPTGRT